ncbi:MAG TPA: endonuclease/exonuclease/phosphatase family protein [Roseiflexaceae bacterium]|nr:endonuclease/exonuclease/phosphatase family protein [Roseiflexaceae bacterium]
MPFKVMSYNIENGGVGRLDLLAATIRRQQPDAVALIEANHKHLAETLARQLDLDLVYGEANSQAAIAWLSRLPIVGSQNHRLPILDKTLLEVVVEQDGSELHLFATHLVHGRTRASAGRRVAEVHAILDVLQAQGDTCHALVGDFNAIHPADRLGEPPIGETRGYFARQPIRLLVAAGYTDCYRQLHRATPGYTYPAAHPWMRLDYIFAAASMATQLQASGVETGEDNPGASDHLPVWAAFR